MRKKLIAAIITAALLIAGCSDTANVSAGHGTPKIWQGEE